MALTGLMGNIYDINVKEEMKNDFKIPEGIYDVILNKMHYIDKENGGVFRFEFSTLNAKMFINKFIYLGTNSEKWMTEKALHNLLRSIYLIGGEEHNYQGRVGDIFSRPNDFVDSLNNTLVGKMAVVEVKNRKNSEYQDVEVLSGSIQQQNQIEEDDNLPF